MDFKPHFEQAWQTMTSFFAPLLISTLVLLAVSLLSFGIMAPVALAGYMQSLLLALREQRKPEPKDIFARLDLFLPLFGFTLLVALAVLFGMIMLIVPGIIVLLAAVWLFAYLLPLMTDQGLGLLAAMQESARMSLQGPLSEHFAVVAVVVILGSIGGSTAVGSLLTHPYACLFLLSVYEEKRRRLLTAPPSPPPGA